MEHGRGQGAAGTVTSYLQAEQRIPISKDFITSSSASAMWFIRDACGIVCAVITWFLVFYAEFVVLFVMLLPSKNLIYSIVNGALFNVFAFLALASHLRAMCTDPVSTYVVLFAEPEAYADLPCLHLTINNNQIVLTLSTAWSCFFPLGGSAKRKRHKGIH